MQFFTPLIWNKIKEFMIQKDKYMLVYSACRRFYELNSKSGVIRSYNKRHKLKFCYFKHNHSRINDSEGTDEIERAFFYKKGFMKNDTFWQKYSNNNLQYNIQTGIVHLIHSRAKWRNEKGYVLPYKKHSVKSCI